MKKLSQVLTVAVLAMALTAFLVGCGTTGNKSNCCSVASASTGAPLQGHGNLKLVVSRSNSGLDWPNPGFEVFVDGAFIGHYVRITQEFPLQPGKRKIRVQLAESPSHTYDCEPPFFEREVLILGGQVTQELRFVFEESRK